MRLRRAKFLAAVVLAVPLAACGSSSSHPATAPSNAQVTSQATAPSVSQVASQLGATDVQSIDPTLYATDEASAKWHGRDIDIATFTSQEKRDNWIKVAGSFVTIVAKGPLWVAAE